MHRAGVSPYTWKWAAPDLRVAWAEWRDAPEMVQLLSALFPWGRVAAPLQTLAPLAPTLGLSKELEWGTAEGLYNAACFLDDAGFGSLLVDVYRSQFPLPEVAAELRKLVGSEMGPVLHAEGAGRGAGSPEQEQPGGSLLPGEPPPQPRRELAQAPR